MKTSYVPALTVGALLLVFLPPATAQTVSTLVSSMGAPGDGIVVAASGDIFVAGGSTPVVLKITPEGTVSTFAEVTSSWLAGIFIDNEGNLIVANYSANAVNKISPEGEISTFATGLNGPAGVFVNANNETFISEFGANFSGQGRAVQKISPDGAVETYIEGQGLQDAIGIVMDEDGNIYVSNWNSGEIYKSDGTTMTLFADIDGTINQIAYSDGYLYVPSPSLRQIFRIDLEGNIEHIAGSGAQGSADGPALEATFSRPNGIAVAPDGETFYIVDADLQAIRVLDLENSTSIHDDPLPSRFELQQNYPNPFNLATTISFTLGQHAHVKLSVHDLLGREVALLVSGDYPAGRYKTTWNAAGLPSGVYLYRIKAGAYSETKKLMLQK